MPSKSLTTVSQFLPMIAHLPLKEVDRTGRTLVMLPLEVLAEPAHSELRHALEISARKRGLTVKFGCAVWTVKGFAL